MTKTSDGPEAHVIYNAECPVCAFEIDHYRAYAARENLPLSFHDLNAVELARWGLTEDQAARRLYVEKDGRLESGIPAFLILWREMPRYRWLARLVGAPGVRRVAGWIYDHALAALIYRWHRRRKARAAR
ncbi:MAG: DUF393 domain-containing protein [Pseudomonadota bacterium]